LAASRLVRRSGESVVVDLVRELLSRAEIRALVDVRALDLAGYGFEEALRAAATKDASLTPGQLAWVLSQITIGPEAALPGGVDPGQLEEYRIDLVSRLGRMAFSEVTGPEDSWSSFRL
jgi:hypothetical protein